MKKIFILILITVSIFLNCQQKKPKESKLDYLVATFFIYGFTDECVNSYGYLNSLYNTYTAVFPSYNGAKVLWIADSTIHFAKLETDFTTELSDNRAIYGNTACDFLNQIRAASPGYETLIVASADGNGVLRGISAETSLKTLKKVFSYGKDVIKVKNIIVVSIHPIPDQDINTRKNAINYAVKKEAEEQGYCYIDMPALFGKSDTQFPDSSQMRPGDKIHYDSSIYPLLKSKIKTQCGVDV